MIPVFKDEEAKKNYINSMLGFLLATEKIVAEAKEKIQESIASDNTDQLIDALEFFCGCIFSLGNVNQKVLEDSQNANPYYPTYEERNEMLELLIKAYQEIGLSNEDYTKSEIESRKAQKVKFVNKVAKTTRMGFGEFRPYK